MLPRRDKLGNLLERAVPDVLKRLWASPLGQWTLALLVLAVPYFATVTSWHFPACVETLLFPDWAADTVEYLRMGEWVTCAGGEVSYGRPYLFPLVLQLLLTAGGPMLVWFYHFGVYLGSGLLMKGIVSRSAGPLFGYVVLVFYAFNATIAALTLLALTEITTLFLVTLVVYFLTRGPEACPWRRPAAFFCLGLLTVVKPVFLHLWVLCLLWLLVQEGRDLIRQRPKAALVLGGLAVVAIQFVLMKACFGSFCLSQIGQAALRDYYYQQLYAEVEGIDFEDASADDHSRIWQLTKDDTEPQIAAYSIRHLPQALAVLFRNVRRNIEVPTVLSYVTDSPKLLDRMGALNKLSKRLHIAALLAAGLLLVLDRFRLRWPLPGFAPIYFGVLYVLLMAGLIWSQGDRLTVFVITAWLSIYPALFVALWRRLTRQFLGSRMRPALNTGLGVCTR